MQVTVLAKISWERNVMTTTNPLPILIGHNDTLLRLYAPARGYGRSFFVRSDQGHIDLPRAHEGGLAGGFFAVFVPADPSVQRAIDVGMAQTGAGYELHIQPTVETPYAQHVTIGMMALL